MRNTTNLQNNEEVENALEHKLKGCRKLVNLCIAEPKEKYVRLNKIKHTRKRVFWKNDDGIKMTI